MLPSANQSAAQRFQPAALWTWQENVITNPSDQKAFFAFAKSHGVNRIYIACQSSIQYDRPRLAAFLQKAAEYGMATELLFGDARWVLPGNGYPHQGYAVSLVSKYTAQLLAKMKTGRPVAVHFDVEPYTLPEWKSEQNAIALDYVTLVTHLASAAHKLGVRLSTDEPWWYGTISVTNGSRKTPMNQLVMAADDDYVIEDYWDTASRMDSQATPNLTLADGMTGKEVVIGALTSCNSHPAETSFCNQTPRSGTAYMERQLADVVKAEARHHSFAGLAIEDYAGFKALKP